MQLLGAGARWSGTDTPGVVAMGPDGWEVARNDPGGRLNVNGQPVVSRTALRLGDRLQIGRKAFKVLYSAGGAGAVTKGPEADESTTLHARFSRWSQGVRVATFELRVRGGGEWRLGRGECDISLPDAALSRQHARLIFRQGDWWLEDLGSLNGLTVKGGRASRVRLSVNARVRLGRLRMRVLQSGVGPANVPRTFLPREASFRRTAGVRPSSPAISGAPAALQPADDATGTPPQTADIWRPTSAPLRGRAKTNRPAEEPSTNTEAAEPLAEPVAKEPQDVPGVFETRSPRGRVANSPRVETATNANTQIVQAFVTVDRAKRPRGTRKGLFWFRR